ncbi:tetratricopeptide repeat protein [bacterium]|nr:MAG: tetratricopeptide repeat protein [bacterium]
MKKHIFAAMAVFILSISSSFSFAEPPDSDVKTVVMSAVVRGEWNKVTALEQAALSDERLRPLSAYAVFKTGDKAKAIKLLEGRGDALSALIRGIVEEKAEISVAGIKGTVKGGYSAFFVETLDGEASAELGIFPKRAEKAALKKAFYSLVAEPTVDQFSVFQNKVLPLSDAYVFYGETICRYNEKMFSAAFVNIEKLAEDLGLTARAKTVTVGLVTRKGVDAGRAAVAKGFKEGGVPVEDLGRGEFYSLGDKKRLAGIILEITENTKVSPLALKGSFKHIEADIIFSFFNASTDAPLFELKRRSSVVHPDEVKGAEIALQKAYDDVLKELGATVAELSKKVQWRPGGMPALDVAVTSEKVFSSSYKFYSKGPLGTVVLKNNTGKPLQAVKLAFFVKDYMDFSTQTDIEDIAPGAEVKKDINAIFNNKILDLNEDTFLQSEMKVSFVNAGKPEAVSVNHPVYFYDRHALTWDDKGKIASFITPKDTVILDFAGKVISGYRETLLPKNMAFARAVFDAMGILGISYSEDPNNPYQAVSNLANVVDFVQFPRETLARKSGDCDDLTSLYASLLESIGIKTMLIDAPGHIYMMLDSGITEDDKLFFGFPEESYVVRDGALWVPVETTMSGSSFSAAWKKAVEEYHFENGKLKFIDLRDAWQMNSPPTMPSTTFDAKVSKNEIEKKFPGELASLENQRLEGLSSSMEKLGAYGLKELMIFYGRLGLLDRALDSAKKILKTGKDADTLNNMGNIYYLKGDIEKALGSYIESLELAPDDAEVFVNLSRAYLKKNAKAEAKEAFEKAVKLDAKVKDRHINIYMGLGK